MKKSVFFDFFNRQSDTGFKVLLSDGRENIDYINWNDFLLPASYGDSQEEYQAIRNECALFDLSPMRKIHLSGTAAGTLLDTVLTRPVSAMQSMRGGYVAFCDVDGMLKDDSILYKFSDEHFLLMPSDIDHSLHFDSIREKLCIDEDDVIIKECTHEWSGLALQGPLSATVLNAMGFDDVELIQPFEFVEISLDDSVIQLARMGFTADLGYECWFNPSLVGELITRIELARRKLGIPLPGYGLDALEVCRLEGGFVVAGWDFSTELDLDLDLKRSPFEVGLGWMVDLEGANFVGKAALQREQKNGQKWFKRTIKADIDLDLEDGGQLYANIGDEEVCIGMVTSSAWSWGLGKFIGNASVSSKYRNLGEAILVVANGEKYCVTLGREPHLELVRRNEIPAKIEKHS
ncbi:MAG: hypothetical protein CMK43_02600 [Porticoccaceae bacterium]|nr:hypothetical protein [Porticoccaceae bacterium]